MSAWLDALAAPFAYEFMLKAVLFGFTPSVARLPGPSAWRGAGADRVARAGTRM